MLTAISEDQIANLLIKQLSAIFFVDDAEKYLIESQLKEVLLRCELCFSRNMNKYYSLKGETYFNPFQSAQYTIFLYYFSNQIFRIGICRLLADKLYYLNKIMNACDLFYEIELIGANSGVKDEDIPNDSLVFGYSPNLVVKRMR
ncbi:hypothetical protein NXX63_10700 [Bacteroides fragilis]|nr:hypothetical protein NXV98_11695 [Bacteroides fragilis]UVR68142.1 hypothetical protein NXX63_10700 [Bacteroides fragilis]